MTVDRQAGNEAEAGTGAGVHAAPGAAHVTAEQEHDEVEARQAWFRATRPLGLYAAALKTKFELARAHLSTGLPVRKVPPIHLGEPSGLHPQDNPALDGAGQVTVPSQATHPVVHPAGPGGGSATPEDAPAAADPNWTELGPGTDSHGQATGFPAVSGRVNALAVGPAATNRVYAGTANGGAWLTEDGGDTWQPQDEWSNSPTTLFGTASEADSLAVGALAVSFGASLDGADDVIYVGTGEAYRQDGLGDNYFGVGVRRWDMSNGWALETDAANALQGAGFSRLIVDPADSDKAYAATTQGFFVRTVNNGKAVWVHKPPPPGISSAQNATGLAAASAGANRRYYVAYAGGQIWTYDPTNDQFTLQLTGVASNSGNANYRIALAAAENASLQPPDDRVVYAFEESGRLFRLPEGDANTVFQEVTGMPPVLNNKQGFYDLWVEIEPGTADTVWICGDFVPNSPDLSLWRGTIDPSSLNFGFTMSQSPNMDPTFQGKGVHPDGHAIAFSSDGSASSVWVGCDGGVFFSAAPGTGGFVPKNVGLAITQLQYFDQHPLTDAVVFSGSQDQGTVRYWGGPAWREVAAGDGGGVAIDPNHPNQIMRQYVQMAKTFQDNQNPPNTWLNSALSRSLDGGRTFTQLNFPPVPLGPLNLPQPLSLPQQTAIASENQATSFYSPIVAAVDPATSTTVVAFGTNRVWISEDWGATWVTIKSGGNPYATPTPDLSIDLIDTVNAMPVTALAVVPLTGAMGPGIRVFAATAPSAPTAAASVVYFERLKGQPWTRATTPLSAASGFPAAGIVTDIAVEDAAGPSLYITLGGSAAQRVIYYSGQAQAWSDTHLTYDGTNALNIPAHAIVVDPNDTGTIYVGTDVGCFKGINNFPQWSYSPLNQGLPECAITHLAIHGPTRLLRAATHGRGLWELPVDTTAGTDAGMIPSELYMRVNSCDTGRLPGGARFPWVEGMLDPTDPANSRQVGHWMSPDIKVQRQFPLGGSSPSSALTFYDYDAVIQDSVDPNGIETADETGTNKIYVQVHNRGWQPTNDLTVCLLLARASAGLPLLPVTDYRTPVHNQDTSWVLPGGGQPQQWFFADSASPYRLVPASGVDVRNPFICEYDVDISQLGLPGTGDHVCAAAFIASGDDPAAFTNNSVDQLTMHDRHVAHRNLHLMAPGVVGGGAVAQAGLSTTLIDFHNPHDEQLLVSLVFQRDFTGHLSIALSDVESGNRLVGQPEGWVEGASSMWSAAVQGHWNAWIGSARQILADPKTTMARALTIKPAAPAVPPATPAPPAAAQQQAWIQGRIDQVARLNLNRIWSDESHPHLAFQIQLSPGSLMSAALTVESPAGRTGRLDIIQQAGGQVLGGSSYVVIGAPPLGVVKGAPPARLPGTSGA
jgi:hypothetical protein